MVQDLSNNNNRKALNPKPQDRNAKVVLRHTVDG